MSVLNMPLDFGTASAVVSMAMRDGMLTFIIQSAK